MQFESCEFVFGCECDYYVWVFYVDIEFWMCDRQVIDVYEGIVIGEFLLFQVDLVVGCVGCYIVYVGLCVDWQC